MYGESDIEYLYDGSLAGIFCCVFESIYEKEMPILICPEEQAEPSLFRQKTIKTDEDKAQRVQKSIPLKISPRALELVQNVYLSCMPQKELALLNFLKQGYKQGAKVMQMMGHPFVNPVFAAERHLLGEAHLLKGFVRFADYGGVLISEISPKNFVLPHLVEHFTQRYPDETFMIYDRSHKAALLYENNEYEIVPLEAFDAPKTTSDEEEYRSLWKQFYNTIAIKERYNPKCRRTLMPKRYWENMVEMKEFL